MRNLAVHYCRSCGFYAYYQRSKNAVCPKCARNMHVLDMSYQDFINLDCKERDELLSRSILRTRPLTARLIAPHQKYNARETIARLTERIEELESEIERLEADNKKQKETVEWMHQMIWDLAKKQRLISPEENQTPE